MTNEERVEHLPKPMQEWLLALSNERCTVLTSRMGFQIEDKVGTWDENTDPVLIETIFIEIAERMFLLDLLQEAVDEGRIHITGVDRNGEFVYSAEAG